MPRISRGLSCVHLQPASASVCTLKGSERIFPPCASLFPLPPFLAAPSIRPSPLPLRSRLDVGGRSVRRNAALSSKAHRHSSPRSCSELKEGFPFSSTSCPRRPLLLRPSGGPRFLSYPPLHPPPVQPARPPADPSAGEMDAAEKSDGGVCVTRKGALLRLGFPTRRRLIIAPLDIKVRLSFAFSASLPSSPCLSPFLAILYFFFFFVEA